VGPAFDFERFQVVANGIENGWKIHPVDRLRFCQIVRLGIRFHGVMVAWLHRGPMAIGALTARPAGLH
jgi:hypothetical protein